MGYFMYYLSCDEESHFFLSMYLFYLVFFIAAEELLKKIEAETMPVSIDAESSDNKPGSSGKKGKFKIH